MKRKEDLNVFVESNKESLEFLAIHGNDVVRAMALTLLNKDVLADGGC
ncbi:MAG: hypothetical protein R6U61_08195 [Thermoplasmata archaeon]